MQNKKILLLEDNPDLAFSLEEILDLERPEYKLVSYEDGTLAWDELSKNGDNYDAIILDIMVPGISGMDILKNIRNYNVLKDKLVIMQSGKLEPYIEQKAYDAGASVYLTKPYSLTKFIEVLDERLNDNEN